MVAYWRLEDPENIFFQWRVKKTTFRESCHQENSSPPTVIILSIKINILQRRIGAEIVETQQHFRVSTSLKKKFWTMKKMATLLWFFCYPSENHKTTDTGFYLGWILLMESYLLHKLNNLCIDTGFTRLLYFLIPKVISIVLLRVSKCLGLTVVRPRKLFLTLRKMYAF